MWPVSQSGSRKIRGITFTYKLCGLSLEAGPERSEELPLLKNLEAGPERSEELPLLTNCVACLSKRVQKDQKNYLYLKISKRVQKDQKSYLYLQIVWPVSRSGSRKIRLVRSAYTKPTFRDHHTRTACKFMWFDRLVQLAGIINRWFSQHQVHADVPYCNMTCCYTGSFVCFGPTLGSKKFPVPGKPGP